MEQIVRHTLNAIKKEITELPQSAHNHHPSCLVSIIIPTKDRINGLRELLDSIPQACIDVDYEIIICQDKKNDLVTALLNKYKNINHIVFDEEIFSANEKFSWSKLMNFAFSKASGDWIIFGSDDIIFYPQAISNALKKVDSDNIGGVSFLHKNTVETYGGYFDNYGFDSLNGDKIYINFGLINKKAYNQTKGFDERFKFYWADVDICMQIWNLGFKIIASEDSLVDHINILDKVKTNNSGIVFKNDTDAFCLKWQDSKLFNGKSPLEKERNYFAHSLISKIKDHLGEEDNIHIKSNQVIPLLNKKILIDGVIFYLQKGKFGGISNVWINYLKKIESSKYKENFLILDRENCVPKDINIRKIYGNPYIYISEKDRNSDAEYIDTICKQNHIDLFISTYYTHSKNFPNALMLHDFIPEVFNLNPKSPEWQAKREGISNSQYFISISNNTKKDFERFYPNEAFIKKNEIIHNGVSDIFRIYSDVEKNIFLKKHNITKKYYLICGYRTQYKNVLSFLRAVNLFTNPESFEVIFTGGNNELEDNYKPYLVDLKYRKIDLPQEEMPLIFSCAEALIYLSDYEGFGLPIIEAMRTGCPVITCNNSSINEVAGNAAVYVNNKDILQIKKALESIANVKSELIIKGLTQSKKFSWDISYIKFIRFINHILSEDINTKIKKLPAYTLEQKEILVSAIVSTYNSERFIRGCLEDLVDQSLFKKGQLEIIVIDSASQQNEKKIIDEYMSKYSNISYYRSINRENVYKAWNRGIKMAKGRFITNANTDDRHKSDALEIMANELLKNNGIALVYADCAVTNIENETFDKYTHFRFFYQPEFDKTLLKDHCYIGPQPLWRAKLHKEYGYFDENFNIAGDYEFWLRISKNEIFKHINQVLGLYLNNSGSVEHKNIKETEKEVRIIKDRYKENNHIITDQKNKVIDSYENPAKKYKIGMAVLAYERPEYLEICLNTLFKTNLYDYDISFYIIDDGSVNSKVKEIIEHERDPKYNIKRYFTPKGKNCAGAAINKALNIMLNSDNFDIIGWCDPDALFHPEWLDKTMKICLWAKQNHKDHILGPFSSFNSSDFDYHVVFGDYESPYGKYVVKRQMGMLNYFYFKEDLTKLGFFPENKDDETLMTKKLDQLGVRNFCTYESWVEHIGQDS
ncbi:MAG TPA: glycosyltransferase, partial [Candidatus Cloacimonadota bacterium]|nr:glycosyltransferase [Candidatus Cloacimonadota bacterium]